jgi:hypothetical protein
LGSFSPLNNFSAPTFLPLLGQPRFEDEQAYKQDAANKINAACIIILTLLFICTLILSILQNVPNGFGVFDAAVEQGLALAWWLGWCFFS